MHAKLPVFCVLLWILGLVGMTASRGVFGLEPGALPFDVCAAVWAVGGLSYVFLGTLALVDRGSRG